MAQLAAIPAFNFQDFIFLSGDNLVTESRAVAKAFGKNNKEVVRAIKMLDCGDEFHGRNFALVKETMTYVADGVKVSKETSRTSHYTMTKDGFMFLVMGFTGKAAASIKVAFINAFNAMSDHIRSNQMAVWKQMQEWVARNEASKVRASFGSRLMLARKKVLPELRDEYAKLRSCVQPDMFAIQ